MFIKSGVGGGGPAWSAGGVAAHPRPTVLVDVRPEVLQGALVVVLEELGVDQVIDLTDAPSAVDVAVVSPDQEPLRAARIVIVLPPEDERDAPGTITIDGEEAAVHLSSIDDLLTLLDLRCPGAAPRAGRAPSA